MSLIIFDYPCLNSELFFLLQISFTYFRMFIVLGFWFLLKYYTNIRCWTFFFWKIYHLWYKRVWILPRRFSNKEIIIFKKACIRICMVLILWFLISIIKIKKNVCWFVLFLCKIIHKVYTIPRTFFQDEILILLINCTSIRNVQNPLQAILVS